MCAGAAAAVAMSTSDNRRYSCEVHRCDDYDDGDSVTTLTDNKSLRLRRISSSSPAVVPHCRRHRDNSVVLLEVICDCQGNKQQARTSARPRTRSANSSPSNRSRAACPATGPASDSEVTARSTRSREFCDSGSSVLQVCSILFIYIVTVLKEKETDHIDDRSVVYKFVNNVRRVLNRPSRITRSQYQLALTIVARSIKTFRIRIRIRIRM